MNQDWLVAAELWRDAARRVPRSGRVSLQHAHALRRSRQFPAAMAEYERTIALLPHAGGAWLGYGLALKGLGRRSQALDAFVEALRLDPGLKNAAEELVNYGARGRQKLPGPMGPAAADAFDGLHLALRQVRQWSQDIEAIGTFPPDDYALYRAAFRMEPPPEDGEQDRPAIIVQIDASEAGPSFVRASLQSLLRQSNPNWRAHVIGPQAMLEHPVASLGHVDARISFHLAAPDDDGAWLCCLKAGTVLHPLALAWLAWAAGRFACEAIYSDHDHLRPDWKTGGMHHSPVMQPMFDRFWFQDERVEPLLLLVRGEARQWASNRDRLQRAAAVGPAAHIPLPLASGTALPAATGEAVANRPARGSARIVAVIPTRDNPVLLRRAVETLLEMADRPDLVDISVVSNWTSQDDSKAMLRLLAERPGTTVIDFDEPFNWSRASNIGARASDAELLLFLNDDTEMLTQGWDSELAALFAQGPDVGAVGALLLYPQGGIQHAGVIMGLDAGGPQHEARWQDADARGPADRWTRMRRSAAVTGAFLAMPRTVHDQLGGFDEIDFAIAYNDIDMCLRLREAGFAVLITPHITLVHHESVSRGADLTPEMLAWDSGELETLHGRWGRELMDDPAYNPLFADHGYPFDGFRYPSLAQIVDHVERSARVDPWKVERQRSSSSQP